jgi:hypothetical protein
MKEPIKALILNFTPDRKETQYIAKQELSPGLVLVTGLLCEYSDNILAVTKQPPIHNATGPLYSYFHHYWESNPVDISWLKYPETVEERDYLMAVLRKMSEIREERHRLIQQQLSDATAYALANIDVQGPV